MVLKKISKILMEIVLNRGFILGFLLVAINTVTTVVVENNQSANVYPGSADSIGIPIISTWFLSFLVSPFLLLVTFLPKTLKGIYSTNSGLGTRVESIFIASISYLPCLCLSLHGSVYWTLPNHISIACLFYLSLVYLLFLVFTDVSTAYKTDLSLL